MAFIDAFGTHFQETTVTSSTYESLKEQGNELEAALTVAWGVTNGSINAGSVKAVAVKETVAKSKETQETSSLGRAPFKKNSR